jgi:hypothetical protein
MVWVSAKKVKKKVSCLCTFKSLETVRVFRLFTREGDMEYTGCGNTEHRDLKTRVLYRPDCQVLPRLAWEKVGVSMICTVMEAEKVLPYPGFEQKCSAACYSGRRKYSACVSKLGKLSGEYIWVQKTQKSPVFFIQKILCWRMIKNFNKCKILKIFLHEMHLNWLIKKIYILGGKWL